MLAYERFGRGERKVLALHGWMGDAQLLAPMRHALDEDTFEFVVPAYRGYGASAGIEGRYDLEEIVADLGELIAALGWTEFSVVGHSMGGLVGQRLLAEFPGRVRKLVGVAAVPPSGAPLDEQTMGMFRLAAEDLAVRRGILDFSTGNRLASAWLDRVIAQTATARTAAVQGYLAMFTGSDITARVKGIDVPILVLGGGKEPMDAEAVIKATFLQVYPNATLEMLPECGHCPIDEAPVYVAAAIERFLKAD